MDESNAAPSAMYHCPGESRPIDRPTHLGRLAAFFPACRACPKRDDAFTLTSLQAEQLSQTRGRQTAGARFTAEGLEADSPNDLPPDVVRRLATAVASTVWRAGRRTAPPAVVVGADGSWTSAPLVAAACETLGHCGCRAVEAGAASARRWSRRRRDGRLMRPSGSATPPASSTPSASRSGARGAALGRRPAAWTSCEAIMNAAGIDRSGAVAAPNGATPNTLTCQTSSRSTTHCGRYGSCSIRAASPWCGRSRNWPRRAPAIATG